MVNDPFGDPGLYLDFRFGRRAILFDLGDLAPLSNRELLRVGHAFVSHAHLDHFAGFDRLLRVCLHRSEPLTLVGPPAFVDRVESRLGAYTWNLLGPDSTDFRLLAFEFEGSRLSRGAEFRAREGFGRREAAPPAFGEAIGLETDEYRVEMALLDHGTPCLAFAFRERLRINVRKDVLLEGGLSVGPWLTEAKRALRRGDADGRRLEIEPGRSVSLGELERDLFLVAPGQVVAYVTDAAAHAANSQKIVALARGADQLFIETPFLDQDAGLAAEKRHLTARQAGAIARAAGARRLVPFHFSSRYLDRPDELRREAQAAFEAVETRVASS